VDHSEHPKIDPLSTDHIRPDGRSATTNVRIGESTASDTRTPPRTSVLDTVTADRHNCADTRSYTVGIPCWGLWEDHETCLNTHNPPSHCVFCVFSPGLLLNPLVPVNVVDAHCSGRTQELLRSSVDSMYGLRHSQPTMHCFVQMSGGVR
jgi:hypothetical protein